MRSRTTILVLGPPAIDASGVIVPVAGRRTQALLSALVLSVNHAVPIDRLLEVVWPEGVPPTGMNALQSHISRLRALLGEEAVAVIDHSYTLFAGCEDLDACVFEKSVMQAVEMLTEDPVSARKTLLRALGLWRGTAFGDLADDDPFRVEALRLDELRRTEVELELECDVALGEHIRAIGRLRSALADDPYRERLWLLLVRSLLEEGRRVDALKALDEYDAVMAELGLKPGREAEELRSHIVEGDPIGGSFVDVTTPKR
jgi:DNA-binding SARP family transcriptional activator